MGRQIEYDPPNPARLAEQVAACRHCLSDATVELIAQSFKKRSTKPRGVKTRMP
jgi:hypothetical protein